MSSHSFPRVVVAAVALAPFLSSGAWAQAAACRRTSFTGQAQSLAGADTGLDPALGTQAQQGQTATQAAANGAQQDQQTYTQALQQAQQDTQAAIQKAQQQAQQQASLSPNGTGGLVVPNTPSVPGTPTPAPAAGTVFSDNFSTIDPSKWLPNYPWGKIPNDPTQYAAYVDSTTGNNVFGTGANGLDITVQPTDLDGKPASTGQLHSTQAYQYGYFEMTATLPATKGVGSAFWLMPSDGSGTYSELDVMESLGQDPSQVFSTIHDGGGQQQYVATVPGGVQTPHTYGVDWQADKTTFYVDGKVTGSQATPASMQKPMYMILSNNSTPSTSPSPWGQAVDGSTQLPADFHISNVRVLKGAPY